MLVLMGMVTNVINHFNLDFIIPISKSDNNMDRAHKRGAVINEKGIDAAALRAHVAGGE